MPPVADFWVGDLNSVNFSAAGSNRSAPVGDDTQIMPRPSKSTVVAPPVGAMPSGGMYTSILSVLVSSLPRPPLLGFTLNQMVPVGSRVMPWVGAASPFAAATFRGLNAPVLRSNLPSVRTLFGTLQVK